MSPPLHALADQLDHPSKPANLASLRNVAFAATSDTTEFTYAALFTDGSDDDLPHTYEQATTEPNAPLWMPAIKHEIKALEDNGTRELIDYKDKTSTPS